MDILIKSIISGIITGLILLIAKFVHPKLAGAIGGIPIVFAVSYIFITMSERTAAKTFLLGGVYGALAAIFFSLILIWFNEKFPSMHWVNFAIAYMLCFAVAFLLVHFTSSK